MMFLLDRYKDAAWITAIEQALRADGARVRLTGLCGSLNAVAAATLFFRLPMASQLLIANNREEAYYLANDLEALLGESESEIESKHVLLFPSSCRRPYAKAADTFDADSVDNANELQRTEVIRQLAAGHRLLVVTYPEALSEKVASERILRRNTLEVLRGANLDVDYLIDIMQEYAFERVDFVVEPGQYAVRGGIIDVFSFASEHPCRIELFDDQVDSLRFFDPVTQLSIRTCDRIAIVPNLDVRCSDTLSVSEHVSLFHYFGPGDVVWIQALPLIVDNIDRCFNQAVEAYHLIDSPVAHKRPDDLYVTSDLFLRDLQRCRILELGNTGFFSDATVLACDSVPQPIFNKQFDLLIKCLSDYEDRGYALCLTVTNEQQQHRLEKIFAQSSWPHQQSLLLFDLSIANGFIDHSEKILCFTDHQIFERYHKYTVRDLHQCREALTIKDLYELKPGDFVTHIDYGVGRFSGLEKITTNGRIQEVIRLVYRNNDTLYISIHGLHKISRYVGKEGVPPSLDRLGSSSWQTLKQRTKKQVKDIAKDLIALYAKRKATRGFAYSADSYLQEQLEASFLYEDTPDQHKATIDVKHDMEAPAPMDRLVCGDVGFGKTEVAIRAAFKAVCDSKQVAVLVPSTILAFQHYKTFLHRLDGMPVNIDYLNRFRSTKQKNQIIKDLASGKIDILIGTHAITNKSVVFKDLGLLIIDEEQKFGVAMKEKLRQMKVNVDSLTLTATPIPRTLQFSLMGARDLSVIQTPPPNRQPIETHLDVFNETAIRDAIRYEMARGGQTFFVSNRVENLPEMAGLVARLVPDARIGIAHGQMDGRLVENTLMDFLEGELDVLVATSIVENGLDIPNANTMIINNAQNFGLSDLHQMRGRVGRSNKKAFCYMMIPSFNVLTAEAQKRLKAIEEFSGIGSGFNIAMRDLDIRGAGNILGAEQSGFISEIGYDMYHKILNEAIQELKTSEFRDLFAQETIEKKEFVSECVIETDLEAMLPDDYVTSVSERLLLYKQLADLSKDDEVDLFRDRLIDRFGPIPPATQELLLSVLLRRDAKQFGIARLVLKNDKMSCFFVADPNNPFYQSPNAGKVIRFAQAYSGRSRIRDNNGQFSLVIDAVTSIRSARDILHQLIA